MQGELLDSECDSEGEGGGKTCMEMEFFTFFSSSQRYITWMNSCTP